ncbi:hypothetical protein FCV25MIE_19448, partial [Fagus crenata]
MGEARFKAFPHGSSRQKATLGSNSSPVLSTQIVDPGLTHLMFPSTDQAFNFSFIGCDQRE